MPGTKNVLPAMSEMRRQQVHMVGHQYIGMHCAARLAGELLQPVEITERVLVRGETELPGISPLDYMHGHVREHHARAAGHGRILVIRSVQVAIKDVAPSWKSVSIEILLALVAYRQNQGDIGGFVIAIECDISGPPS